MRVVCYQGSYASKKLEDSVVIEITNEPPKGIEVPSCPQEVLDKHVFVIDTEESNPNNWTGCRVYWMDRHWTIDLSVSIANGDMALLTLMQIDEES